jgi:hypothetical protein
MSQVAARTKRTAQGLAPESRSACDRKGPGVIRIRRGSQHCAGAVAWGPGAGVEAAGGLCLGRNETGAVCLPQHTGELYRRERPPVV